MNIQEQIDSLLNDINKILFKCSKIIKIDKDINMDIYCINFYSLNNKNFEFNRNLLTVDKLDDCLTYLNGYLDGLYMFKYIMSEIKI